MALLNPRRLRGRNADALAQTLQFAASLTGEAHCREPERSRDIDCGENIGAIATGRYRNEYVFASRDCLQLASEYMLVAIVIADRAERGTVRTERQRG